MGIILDAPMKRDIARPQSMAVARIVCTVMPHGAVQCRAVYPGSQSPWPAHSIGGNLS